MKTVNVMVMVEVTIKGDNPVDEVIDALSNVNDLLANDNPDDVVLFVSNINASDIINPSENDEE